MAALETLEVNIAENLTDTYYAAKKIGFMKMRAFWMQRIFVSLQKKALINYFCRVIIKSLEWREYVGQLRLKD